MPASKLNGLGVASLTITVPTTPDAKRKMIAVPSSAAKPRVEVVDSAWTRTMGPRRWCKISISWMRLMRMTPPVAPWRHSVGGAKYEAGL